MSIPEWYSHTGSYQLFGGDVALRLPIWVCNRVSDGVFVDWVRLWGASTRVTILVVTIPVTIASSLYKVPCMYLFTGLSGRDYTVRRRNTTYVSRSMCVAAQKGMWAGATE